MNWFKVVLKSILQAFVRLVTMCVIVVIGIAAFNISVYLLLIFVVFLLFCSQLIENYIREYEDKYGGNE